MKNIKFGIMCNKDLIFPQWQVNAISLLNRHKQINCELLIINEEVIASSSASRIRQLNIRTLLWQIYSFISGKNSEATQKISLNKELSDIQKINCKVKKKVNLFNTSKMRMLNLLKIWN